MAIGSLEAEGKPLALIAVLPKRRARPIRPRWWFLRTGPDAFAQRGLKPGAWRVEMISEPPLCYRLSIPDRASGSFDAGTLNPGVPDEPRPHSCAAVFWTGPAAACAGKIVSSAARAPLSYNPFVPLDAEQEITVKVQNAGSDRSP